MRTPLATYRLQFNPRFDFRDAMEILPYLSMLGISDIYASPVFRANKGSSHGYDITDHSHLNPDLGTPEEFENLLRAVKAKGMGWLQDVVPNHMSYSHENPMLSDVLERREKSPFYGFFDVEWEHPLESLKGKLLAPFLNELYGDALEGGKIKLEFGEEGFALAYSGLRLPLSLRSYAIILSHGLRDLERDQEELARGEIESRDIEPKKIVKSEIGKSEIGMSETGRSRAEQSVSGKREFEQSGIGQKEADSGKIGLKTIEPEETEQKKSRPQIAALKEIILKANENDPDPSLKEALWRLYNESDSIRSFLDSNLVAFNGKTGERESFDLLDELHSEQNFRLCFWKVASDEINYRRFFILNEMISLNAEKDEVFDRVHTLVFDLLEKELIIGLRIDHIDGLYDPEGYLTRLRARLKEGYLVAEKVLLPGETLPLSWPLQGTTGYDFLNCINGVLCDERGAAKMSEVYALFTGSSLSFEDVAYEKKMLIADRHMSGDFDNLARFLKKNRGRDRRERDITLSGVKKALRELLVLLPVYRTYVKPGSFCEADRYAIREALKKAKQRNLDLFHEIDFLERFLLEPEDEELERSLAFVMRLQQFSSPLMAKGVEDTAFYRYHRLLSQNEVGGDPGLLGTTLDEFHRFLKARAESWPCSLNATSTHDTKRGEDARARINVLSELAEEWQVQVNAWSRINEPLRGKVRGEDVPEKNDEYFLYQTLIGAFPDCSEGAPTLSDESSRRSNSTPLPSKSDLYRPGDSPNHDENRSRWSYDLADFRKRARSYLVKSVREAKVHSGWVVQDASYEEAFAVFLDRILDSDEFMKSFMPFERKVAHFGALNSLSQTLVKITAPGVPDFYQGSELWEYSFVDPDNRRPVDFASRMSYLMDMLQREKADILGLMAELMGKEEDGRLKLFLVHRALAARKENPDLFLHGSYERFSVEGSHSENVIAFARRHAGLWAVTVVPRLIARLVKEGGYPLGRSVWGDDRIELTIDAPRIWQDAITGQPLESKGSLRLADVLSHFPVSLLMGKEER